VLLISAPRLHMAVATRPTKAGITRREAAGAFPAPFGDLYQTMLCRSVLDFGGQTQTLYNLTQVREAPTPAAGGRTTTHRVEKGTSGALKFSMFVVCTKLTRFLDMPWTIDGCVCGLQAVSPQPLTERRSGESTSP